jgi:uncharacterized membrane protein YidH (DUF202 family)
MASDDAPKPDTPQSDKLPSETRERTLLAGDRTLLAWYRTAFGAYALAVGLGGVVPKISTKASSFYQVIGAIFAVLGAIAPLLGVWHYLVFQRAAGPERLTRLSKRMIVAFGLITSLLGLAIALLIALGG